MTGYGGQPPPRDQGGKMSKFVCELPQEVQNEIRHDLTDIVKKLGLEFPSQIDDVTYCQTIDDYVDEIMNEKLINIIGYETAYIDGEEVNTLLDFDKYKKYL